MAQLCRSGYLAARRHCLNVAALEAENQFGRLSIVHRSGRLLITRLWPTVGNSPTYGPVGPSSSESAPLTPRTALCGNVLFHFAPALAISAASDMRGMANG